MNAPEESPDPLAIVLVPELRPLAAAARIDRKSISAEDRHGTIAQPSSRRGVERRDDRNLRGGEFARERMLLGDRRIGPAPGAVELHDDRIGILETDLEHPVFVAAEREYPAVARESRRFDGIHDQIW